MRSGDRPSGNAAATDQSAAATEATGNLEDIDAGQAVAGVEPAETATGSAPGEPEPEPDGAGQGPGQEPEQGGPGQEPAPAGRRRSRHRTPAVRGWAPAGLASIRRLRRPRGDRPPRYPGAGGTAFARITAAPAVLVMAWLLVGLPLLLAGAFAPAPMLLLAVPLAVALAAGLRRVPCRWPPALRPAAGRSDAGPRREPGWPAWWGLAGTVAVAAGFALWQFLFSSQNVIVLRDPGTYLQAGYWIAQHGSLPIPVSLASFGGAHPGLGFSSTGFSFTGTSVVPGVMSGLPLLTSAGFWAGGTPAAAAVGPVLGGLAMLAFGGLVGRLAGPQWAPAGALVLGLTLPELYTSRGLFSETAAQVLLFGGLSLVTDALTLGYWGTVPGPGGAPGGPGTGVWRRWLVPRPPLRRLPAQWALMALGGLALGLTAVVRFDGLLDVLPAIPFIGVLLVRRVRAVVAFCVGLLIGAGYGLADGYLLARPFVDSLQPMPELMGLIAAWLAALTLAAVELARLPGVRHGLRALLAGRAARWLSNLGAALAVAALAGLAARPYLQITRGQASGPTAAYVAGLQRLANLPVDPGRLYAEDTLYWVIWYVGVPAVLLGGFGLALLVRRCLRALLSWRDPSGAARVWALPLAIICWGSAAVLWQPEVIPDQPWASRRLVPLVLPGLILFAVRGSAWLRRRARSRGAGVPAASVAAAFCVAALLVPTVATTFGLGLTHSGHNGALRPTADGLALKRTGQGEAAAVGGLCSSLGPSATVVIVDRQLARQFTQVIRGMCGVPAAWMTGQPTEAVLSVIDDIVRTGRRPLLLGARPAQLAPYGGSPVRVLDLTTTQDPHTLTRPPAAPWPIRYVIWMSAPAPPSDRV